jgi:hypothetical protein
VIHRWAFPVRSDAGWSHLRSCCDGPAPSLSGLFFSILASRATVPARSEGMRVECASARATPALNGSLLPLRPGKGRA